jgi:hypothetical protein
MRTTSRRRLDTALVAGGSLAIGAVALVGGVVGDTERVERLWTTAEVSGNGSAQVTEVIDYNFGSLNSKHGIFRVVPDVSRDAPITVDSPDAPDAIQVTPETTDGRAGARIRIGDPGVTVSGRHRYRIEYPLPGVARGTTLDWEAVGTGWEVGIDEAEIHVVAPFELLDPICSVGVTGSQGGCDVTEVAPGHLTTTVTGLDAGEGVSIEARTGSDLATPPPAPEPPASPPDDPGTGLAPPAGSAAAGALVGGLSTAWLVRRAGRERVGAGGPADAAWAGPDASTSWTRVDEKELEAMATTEFAPPAELDPPHGGIVLTEEVRPEHKVAWLIQMAIDGTVDIGSNGADGGTGRAGMPWSDGGDLRLVRTGHGTAENAAVLDTAFAGRDAVELKSYDPNFAAAWRQLQSQLLAWRDTSGMWDPGGGGRKATVRVFGIIGAVAGAVGAGFGGALANQRGPAWLVLAALAGAVAGAGLAAALRAWELRVRTPAGTAAWLRVESFRRFLATSEAYHAEEAAKRGVLREYTAWAVAVGEIDRWRRAVSAASIAPETAGLAYAYMAPLLLSSTTSAATAPSSSGGDGFGGGGFGGGGVGGGAGGGGGGSW